MTNLKADYALTFLVDTASCFVARNSDIKPDQINKCHGLVADNLANLRQALHLAEATIERLNRHDSANGTLDVIRKALV